MTSPVASLYHLVILLHSHGKIHHAIKFGKPIYFYGPSIPWRTVNHNQRLIIIHPPKQRKKLVGGFNPSEKYESNGMIIPSIWKNKIHVPNHQPVCIYIYICVCVYSSRCGYQVERFDPSNFDGGLSFSVGHKSRRKRGRASKLLQRHESLSVP